MSLLDAHFANLQLERDDLEHRLRVAETNPDSTFEEVRVLRRNLEQLEHRLLWRHRGIA